MQEHKEEGNQLVFRNMDATSDIWYFIKSIGLFAQFFLSKACGTVTMVCCLPQL